MPDVDQEVAAPPEPGPNEVTEQRAQMLANHAKYVQGGYSDPEREAERARQQLAESPGSIDWTLMEAEVTVAMRKRLDELSAETEARRLEQDAEPAEPEPAIAFDIAKIRRYKQLREMQSRGEAETKAFKEEADKIEVDLIEMFAESGVQNFNVDGKTVYLNRTVFAQRLPGVTSEEVQQALIDSDAAELVKPSVNAQTLNAYVRELTEDDDAPGLPEPLKAVLEAGERYSVRIIAGGTKAKSKTHSK